MDDPQRASLETRIIERLGRLDEATLHELDTWLAQDDERPVAPHGRWTRRNVLAALIGTLTVGGGVGAASWLLGEESPTAPAAAVPPTVQPTPELQPLPDMSATLAQLQGDNEVLAQNLDASNGLLSLFEELDNVGLDRVVEGGLGLVAAALGRMAQGAAGLREGLTLAQQRINELDQSFAGLDEGLARAEGVVSGLSNLMQGLEDRLRAAGEPVAPITDALGSFFKGVVERIPAVGPRIVETIERVEEIIGAIPESIENINRDLLTPLRTRFFPRDGDSVTVRLIDPLTGLLFTPADQLLLALEEMGQTWQSDLQQPAQEKLEKRADVRQKINAYKSEHNL